MKQGKSCKLDWSIDASSGCQSQTGGEPLHVSHCCRLKKARHVTFWQASNQIQAHASTLRATGWTCAYMQHGAAAVYHGSSSCPLCYATGSWCPPPTCCRGKLPTAARLSVSSAHLSNTCGPHNTLKLCTAKQSPCSAVCKDWAAHSTRA